MSVQTPGVRVGGAPRQVERDENRLRRVSAAVNVVDKEIEKLVGEMSATLLTEGGFGLAAIQIGSPLRVVVIRQGNGTVIALINPEIVWRSEQKVTLREGCLSLPGVGRAVRRPAQIKLTFTDIRGNPQSAILGGMMARVVQHEVDHLDGILMVDRSKFLSAAATAA